MAENFPNLIKHMNILIQEAELCPIRINPKESAPRFIIVKLQKPKAQRKSFSSSRGEATPYL
jgi:hypothetical protein